jgi:uncharacterized membrane protein YcaP (DUF421 family)
MNIKNYFDLELRSTIINAVIGGVIGYASFLINQPILNLVLAIVVLAITSLILKKIWKISKEGKWWISNAVIIFLFVWLIVWTIFYNTKIV